jgi:Lrp/AsnC family transcriptional regulator, leucine-responsive regulatory protein
VECHRVTGEDCFILKAHLPEIASLDRVLDRFLVHGQTTTSIVQSSPVLPRSPPISAAPARKSARRTRD